MTRTRTASRRWRRAAVGMAIAASAFSVSACGEDVVDDDIQEDVEQGVDDAEQEVEDATDGEDEDG